MPHPGPLRGQALGGEGGGDLALGPGGRGMRGVGSASGTAGEDSPNGEGGVVVDRLFRIGSSRLFILALRLVGLEFLVVGIVTAATDTAFGPWIPLYWFLLAIAALLGVLCAQLLRVMLLMEGKQASEG